LLIYYFFSAAKVQLKNETAQEIQGKSIKKVQKKCRKGAFSGFFRVSFVPFLQVISIFRRYFC